MKLKKIKNKVKNLKMMTEKFKECFPISQYKIFQTHFRSLESVQWNNSKEKIEANWHKTQKMTPIWNQKL